MLLERPHFDAAASRSRRPPTARGPAARHKLLFLVDPIALIEECERELGDAFRLKLSEPGWFFFSDPAHVKEIYTGDTDVLRAGEAKKGIFGKLLGSSSSLLLDGAPHLARRRLLLPQFRGEQMSRYTARIVREARAAVAAMPLGRPFSMHERMHRLTLRIMLSALFGPEERASAGLWQALERFANHAASSRLLMAPALQWDLGPLSPWGRVVREVRHAETAVLSEIERRRRASAPSADLLGLLMDATGEQGERLTDREIRDEVLTLVVAGHEITSMVTTWLVYAIASRSDVERRVRDELDAVIADRDPEADDVARLAYLEAVLRESMRYYSTVPVGSARLVTRDVRIGGFDVPRGAVINVALHLLHRRPELFPSPNRFDPTRFTTGERVSPYHWAPFGGGTRRCLGMAFAMHEIQLIAAVLFSRLAITVPSERVRAVRRGAFVAPERGLRVVVERRRA